MDYNMVFSYNYVKQKKRWQKQMHLCRGPLQWPCKQVGAIQMASPNAAYPGLLGSHWTPPSGNYLLRITPTATANEISMKSSTFFVGHFDGHGDAPLRYRAHLPIEEIQGFTTGHWMPPSGKYCGQ
jgi:hypothetical protein